jgi:hypothetical protein
MGKVLETLHTYTAAAPHYILFLSLQKDYQSCSSWSIQPFQVQGRYLPGELLQKRRK